MFSQTLKFLLILSFLDNVFCYAHKSFQMLPYRQSYADERFDLKQVNADDLPPGEYDIVALFDDQVASQQRQNDANSFKQQVEFVRPPGSIFESYNRKSSYDERVHDRHQKEHGAISYASQNIQFMTDRMENAPYHSIPRADYFDGGDAVVKSLPPRKTISNLAEKYQYYSPVRPSYYDAMTDVIPRPPAPVAPAAPVEHSAHLSRPRHHDYGFPPIATLPPPTARPEIEDFPLKEFTFRANQNRYPEPHAAPVKKEAFRFPDEPVRQTEQEFIYKEDLDERAKISSKRKVISSTTQENDFAATEATPGGKRRGTPRVIDSNKARNPLQRLKEIAGDSSKGRGSSSSKSSTEQSVDFVCPHDGHFGDPKDCSKFYRCAHGTALPDFCPGDLFWNSATEQCDWPEETTCQFDPENPDIKTVEQPTYVYLTFDDGPNEGTDHVLNALAAEGVRATFFINSDNLYDPKREKAERNARSLLRVVDAGHVLADHSFNHMAHNSDGPKNAYQSIERDLKYFGPSNINPVLDLLWGNDRKDENLLNFVNTTMMGLVRMPYSNNWRIPDAKIHADCGTCTVPSASGQRGIEMADIMSADGRYVIGWDQEWAMNFNENRNQYGGSVAYMKLRTRHTKSPKKIVLLSHDIAYRPGGPRNEEEELRKFLQLAKKSGYTFRTMDTYVTDNVNV